MKSKEPFRIKTITGYHQLMELPNPEYPLISVIVFASIKRLCDEKKSPLVHDFYSIALKRNFNGKMKYGQQEYDFQSGVVQNGIPAHVADFLKG